MKINFYDTRLKNKKTVLIKERTLYYEIDKTDNPKDVVRMMNKILEMNSLA